MDLTPSSQLQGQAAAPLPDVTMVFISVEGAAVFLSRHNRNEIHVLHKVGQLCLSRHAVDGAFNYICNVYAITYAIFVLLSPAEQTCLLPL